MSRRASELLWAGGRPIRGALVGLIRIYRASLGALAGGRCRFYPSCSAYAEEAIREQGVVRGVALAMWRILRCSPLTAGGVEYPPKRRPWHSKFERAEPGSVYDGDIQEGRRPGGTAPQGATR